MFCNQNQPNHFSHNFSSWIYFQESSGTTWHAIMRSRSSVRTSQVTFEFDFCNFWIFSVFFPKVPFSNSFITSSTNASSPQVTSDTSWAKNEKNRWKMALSRKSLRSEHSEQSNSGIILKKTVAFTFSSRESCNSWYKTVDILIYCKSYLSSHWINFLFTTLITIFELVV